MPTSDSTRQPPNMHLGAIAESAPTPSTIASEDRGPTLANVNLAAILTDGGTQTRAKINTATVSEYVAAMAAGATFPAIILYTDRVNHWLADGFHRYRAAQKIGHKDILAEVRPGTYLDALEHAIGANVANGLRRTNADKRCCVKIALQKFDHRSAGWIAQKCSVSHTFVAGVRLQLATVASSSGDASVHASAQTSRSRVGIDGKRRTSARSSSKPKSSDVGARHEHDDLDASLAVSESKPEVGEQTASAHAPVMELVNPDAIYELADGRTFPLPLKGFLTSAQLKTALGRLKLVAKQLGGGTMQMGLLSSLEHNFLKITDAVFDAVGCDADSTEKERAVEVLRAVADTLEMTN